MATQSGGWGLICTTPPTAEPVSVDQAREWLRVDDASQDATIAMLIAAARGFIERRTNRALLASGWRLTLDRFPCPAQPWPVDPQRATMIQLPRGPVSAVSAITYIDPAGATQTLAAGNYVADLGREPARVAPAFGKAWPATQCRPAAVMVDFTAGYADAASIPADLTLALRLLLAHWFENRETVTVGVVNTMLQLAFEEIVDPWRVWTFA